jgi:lysophospholipase L1-like esterase
MSITNPNDLANIVLWLDSTAGLFDATSGGSAVTTDHATIARWEDQSGNGKHVTQATSGKRPVLDATAGLVVSEIDTDTSSNQYFNATAFTVDRQNFSVFWVLELNSLRSSIGSYQYLMTDSADGFDVIIEQATGKIGVYSGGFNYFTTLRVPSHRSLVGIVASSGGATLWVNGQSETISAFGAGTGNFLTLFGTDVATGPLRSRVRHFFAVQRAVNSTERSDIWAWAQTQGVDATTTANCIIVGDSLTEGYGTTNNKSWPRQMNRPTGLSVFVQAKSGDTAYDLLSNISTLVYPCVVSGQQNQAIIWLGTNDASASRTAAQIQTDLESIATGLKANGVSDVTVFGPIPRSSGAISGTLATLNTNFRSSFTVTTGTSNVYTPGGGYSGDIDTYVELCADSGLDDSSDTTYFLGDGTHLTNAGEARVIAYADAVLLSPPPSFIPFRRTRYRRAGSRGVAA